MMCEKHNIINLKYFTKAQSRFALNFLQQYFMVSKMNSSKWLQRCRKLLEESCLQFNLALLWHHESGHLSVENLMGPYEGLQVESPVNQH